MIKLFCPDCEKPQPVNEWKSKFDTQNLETDLVRCSVCTRLLYYSETAPFKLPAELE